jgi:hypothetical protein
MAPHVSYVVHVASLATTDLRSKLERRRSSEDGHITIECQQERCRCRGRNLDGDFDVVDTALLGKAARTPTPSVGSGGGCMVLALHLRMVVWSHIFWPHLPKKYDMSVNPTEFQQIYSTSILAAGGNEVVMANYFPVALTSTARSWFMNLPKGSLTSWAELCRQFMINFESAYARPGNEVDLMPCNSDRESNCGPSSSSYPRFDTPSPASPMLLLLLLFDMA